MIEPRSYKPVASVLHNSYEIMLRDHPEAFDCIVHPAKSSEHNEILADNRPVATLLDRDERAQEYDPPEFGRAMIVARPDLMFGATDSGMYESFHDASEAITLLLSKPDLQRHSIVQWKEFQSLESEETYDRVVYIADIKPMGRTLNAGMLYICYPLPAMGEKPDVEPEIPPEDNNEDGIPDGYESVVGVL